MTIAQKEHLQRLKTLNDMIAGGLSREQFVALFTQVLDFVKKIDKGNSEMREKMEAMHERLMSQLTSDNAIQINSAMQEAKTMIINMFGASMEKMSREHTKMMSEMKKEMEMMDRKMANIRDGKDADEAKIVKEVLSQVPVPIIPTIEEIEKDLPELGAEIRNALELLQGKERLNKSAIEGLEEELEKIEAKITAIPKGRIGGMRKIPIVKRINLTSQIDGQTRSFSLPRDTVDILGIWGTQFPLNFDTADWSFSGNTLTLASGITTPASGQTLFALVETLFY